MPISRTKVNALVDDDGSGSVGTSWAKARVVDIYDDIDALMPSASGQLLFPATQIPSANVNTLDDYEEGTFTPAFVSSGGGAGTYSGQNGYYVKIGKLVHVQGYLHLATLGTLAAGTVTISGLPFTSGSGTNEYSVVNAPYWGVMTSTLVHLGGYIAPSVTVITMVCRATAGASIALLAVADLAGTTELMFQGSYRASA